MFGIGDDAILAILTKPPVGTRLSADFGVLTFGQGGCGIHLIEIETANEPLFTAAGVPAKRHNHAAGQIRDWHEWIHPNRILFMHDMMARVESLPEPPSMAANLSFCTRAVSSIQSAWRGFCGYDDPVITYTLIMGRWAQLNAAHKKRLLQFNKHESKLFELFTYSERLRTTISQLVNPTSPNHALQRTAPHVTAPASAAAFPPAMQEPRQPRPSLSLGSLGPNTS